MKLKENERIDDLQCDKLKIIQNEEGFCFGIDSVLLSEFAKEIKKTDKVIDLGTGTGILSFLIYGKRKAKDITGVEIQKEVADMAKRSVKLNGLENNIKIICSDIKNLEEKNCYDVVICNPPYKELKTGIINENEKKLISRHEISATLEDFIKISKQLLKDKGSLYMVHKSERLVDIVAILREYKIEPKKIRFIFPKEGKDSNLVLIKAVKGGNRFLKIEKPLYVYDKNGDYTQEIKEIYK